VCGVARLPIDGEISPASSDGDRRSGRVEVYRDYLLGLVRRQPDMTLLDKQERLIANCGERFSVLVSSLEQHRLTESSHSKILGRNVFDCLRLQPAAIHHSSQSCPSPELMLRSCSDLRLDDHAGRKPDQACAFGQFFFAFVVKFKLPHYK
jgi:hypothetical protein